MTATQRLTASRRFKVLALAVASCFAGEAALANPTGHTVVNGTASVVQNGNLLQITNSPSAIINWQSFSIGANEITRFIQQSAASSVLNRVGPGASPSQILGTLQSTLANGTIAGRVFLINPNGITFGAGAQIDVGGLVASTLNMTDADFLAGRMRFGDGLGKTLVNEGNITTTAGGNVYLVGPAVTNKGIITSPKGEVILAAGNSVELVEPGTPNLRVEITAPDNQAVNLGQIVADAGRVGIYAGLINQNGTIRANSAVVTESGQILLKATKGISAEAGSVTQASGAKGGSIRLETETGTIRVAGQLDATGSEAAGGSINLAVIGGPGGIDLTTGLYAGNAAVNIRGTGNTTTLNGDTITAGVAITIQDSVILGAPSTITLDTTNNGGTPGGAPIVIAGTVNDDATPTSLRLSAGRSVVSLDPSGGLRAVGNITPIQGLTVVSASVVRLPSVRTREGGVNVTISGSDDPFIRLGGDIDTTQGATGAGNVSFSGPVRLGTNVQITTNHATGADGSVSFAGAATTVNPDPGSGPTSLAIAAGGGNVTFGGAVGNVQALQSLTVSSANAVNLSAVNVAGNLDITARGNIFGNGDITVTGTSRFDAGTAAIDVTRFNDFQGAVTLVGGDVRINQGSLNPLKLAPFSVERFRASSSFSGIELSGSYATTVGFFDLNTPAFVRLTGDTSITSADGIGLNGDVFGPGALALTQTSLFNNIFINGRLGGNSSSADAVPLGGLTIHDASLGGLNLNEVNSSGNVLVESAGTLSVNGNLTGSGAVSLSGVGFTNNARISAAGELNIDANGGAFVNSAGAVISGSGTLDASGTVFTNHGTLRPGGSGAPGSLSIIGDAAFSATSVIEIEAQGSTAGQYDTVAVSSNASLGGELRVSNISGYAPANGDTLVPVTFGTATGNFLVVPADTYTETYNATNFTLAFGIADLINRWVGTSGDWGVATNWSLGHVPTDTETVLIDVAGLQTVTVSGGDRAAFMLTSEENFRIKGGELGLGGASAFNGSFTLAGGSLRGAGDVTVNGKFIWTGGKLAGTGTFTTTGLSVLDPHRHSLHLKRDWINFGTAQWQAERGRDLFIREGNTLTNAAGGTLNLAAGKDSNIRGEGSLVNEGTLNKNGNKENWIKAAFTNLGTVNVNSGTLGLKHSTGNDGVINIGRHATLDLSGHHYANRGLISGTGTLDVRGVTFTNDGTVAPGAAGGASIGKLTIDGDYRQGAHGVLLMGVAGKRSGQYDELDVNGKAYLDGTLTVSLAGGYVPRRGDDYKLITYKSRSGKFDTLVAPAGFDLVADYDKKSADFKLVRD